MADIFISYKKQDREHAQRLASKLAQHGYDVWWDFELLSGDPYRKVIERVIDECKAAIVLWSERAKESAFVVDEASYAMQKGKLCPARVEDCTPPFGFGQLHVSNLIGWEGDADHPGFVRLLSAIEAKTGKRAQAGMSPRSAEVDAQTAEIEAFKAAQIQGGPTALRAFVDAFPTGAFASFVHGQLKANAPEPRTRTPRRKAKFDETNYVFVSYPTDIARDLLTAVVRELLANRLSVWMYDPSHYSFTAEELAQLRWQEAGGSWRRQTLDAIEKASAMVALVNEYSLQCRFQPAEFELAARDQKLLPCVVSDLDMGALPELFQDLHIIHLTPEMLDTPVGQNRLGMLGRDVTRYVERTKRSS